MDALISLLGPFWGWIGGAAAIVIGLFGIYHKGKSTGVQQERTKQETAAAKQQMGDRISVWEVKDDVAKRDDDQLLDSAAPWVRNKQGGRSP